MKHSKKSNSGSKSIVIDFQGYVKRKIEFKKVCQGCSYGFVTKDKSVCFCYQCTDGLKNCKKLKVIQAILKREATYGRY